MSDPLMLSLALGVAGNLATNVVQSFGDKLEDTRAGKALAKVGLLKPGFEARLKASITEAASTFLHDHSEYNLSEIHSFLESKSFARDLRDMILDQKGLDSAKMMSRLETYVGVPLSEAPDSWPNYIDPELFVSRFFKIFTYTLGSQADEGMIWLGNAIGAQGITLSKISRKLDLLIDSQSSEPSSEIFSIENDSFRKAYLEHVVGRAQRISTPGARELRGINQSLNIAYISLNLKSATGAEAIRAESFLSQHRHVAIRGPAGSGKTTLLSWLITKCPSDCQDVDEKWSGFVPFFVPLRKVARLHHGPPSLARLVEYSVDNKLWTLETPKGWVDRIVSKEKRAILMIDGVDELPPSRRVEFWDWLEEFVSAYPDNRVIVTSRALPGAPSDGSRNEQWNPPKTFVDAQLQDMSDADVTNFIHHWHDSIDSAKLEDSELISLAEARASLPVKLEDAANRRIRELCNTPLLCAMICVLHWKEEGYLPRQRVEVYERCCDMLIEARDHKRGVLPPPGAIAAMSKSDKEMVLQQLAIEMMHNRDDTDAAADDIYRIEISKDKALAWIQPRITRFQSTLAREASAGEVLDYLVERTGLLREPAKDLIDFPHRTFQEYLAACAAGADSQEAMLARQADDDQWHETIMLAAGTSTGGVSFGRKLIETLIRRGEKHQSAKERSQKIRKTCFALALGCLENLRQQDEDLRESVLSHLNELVPPRNDVDARILSVAGDAAVSHLSYHDWKDENTATVAACARSLRLIGTTEAIKALSRGYSSDARQAVVGEVCRTGLFEYSTIPLVRSSVDQTGKLPRFAQTVDLSLIATLDGLKEIEVDAREAKHLERIQELSGLETAVIEGISERSDFLHVLPSAITTLSLVGSALPHGDWLARLDRLSAASLTGLPALDVQRVVDEARKLTSLSIVASNFDDARQCNRISDLHELYLAGLPKLKDVSPLGENDTLERLFIDECSRLSVFPCSAGFNNLVDLSIEQSGTDFKVDGILDKSNKLESLSLSSMDGLSNLAPFSTAGVLRSIYLENCRELQDVDALSDFNELQSIDLARLNLLSRVNIPSADLERISVSMVPAITSESFGAGLPKLRNINVERCVRIDSLSFLAASYDLNGLRLSMLPKLSSLSVLRNFKNLASLELRDCDGIEDLSDIEGLPLEELMLFSMDSIFDTEVIATLGSLKTLTIVDCDGIKDLSFAASLPNLETIWLHSPENDVHVPEALSPKVSRGPSGRSVYIRQRKPWWKSESWMLHELRRGHAYRRHPRARPYRWFSH